MAGGFNGGYMLTSINMGREYVNANKEIYNIAYTKMHVDFTRAR